MARNAMATPSVSAGPGTADSQNGIKVAIRHSTPRIRNAHREIPQRLSVISDRSHLTFPVTGARPPAGATYGASARVRVDWGVSRLGCVGENDRASKRGQVPGPKARYSCQ